jgi:RNA polymerase sigma factor (sigma-70 family)
MEELQTRHRRIPVAAARRQGLSGADVDHVVRETWRQFTIRAAEIETPERLVDWLWSVAAAVARATVASNADPVRGEASGCTVEDPPRRSETRELARHADGTLVVLAQRGCDGAFEELVRRFNGLVTALARRYRLSSADADDIAQLTFLQLHRHLSRLRQPECVVGWVATTARRECLRMVMRRREEPLNAAAVEQEADTADACDRMIANETAALVGEAMKKLPARSEQLLQLLIWDGRSYLEISMGLGMPIGSIGPTRERALKQLARRPEIASALDERKAG